MRSISAAFCLPSSRKLRIRELPDPVETRIERGTAAKGSHIAFLTLLILRSYSSEVLCAPILSRLSRLEDVPRIPNRDICSQ